MAAKMPVAAPLRQVRTLLTLDSGFKMRLHASRGGVPDECWSS